MPDQTAWQAAFRRFQESPLEQLRVAIRRRRAEEIKELLNGKQHISLETFNKEVWNVYTGARINGADVNGIEWLNDDLTPEQIDDIRQALAQGQMEFHGNSIWGSGAKVYGAPLHKKTVAEKEEFIAQAIVILNSAQHTAHQKAEALLDIPGFGPNIASGLVMVFHPTKFALWNDPSKQALQQLGYPVKKLPDFEESARQVRTLLQAQDFIELDWFLYLLNEGRIVLTDEKPVPAGRYWVIAPGEGARLWGQFVAEEMIAIGWDGLGDLRGYANRDEITASLQKADPDGPNPFVSAKCCWEFAKEMQVGDYVLAKLGIQKILGFGKVTSDYRFDPDRTEYHHLRGVEWLNQGQWQLPDGLNLPLKTLTDVTNNKRLLDFAAKEGILSGRGKIIDQTDDIYDIPRAMQNLFMEQTEFQKMLDLIARKRNLILQGPPGVGKSFVARRLAYVLVGREDPSKVETVQFHQSYAYEDFIQGYRPRDDGGFELRNGVFYEFCERAKHDPSGKYVFIIDEINRGNLSKIFGELLLLIEGDKRGPQFAMSLTYSRSNAQRFFVPDNVYLLGMMNTADRSLALVDFALRRRFAFLELKGCVETPRFQEFLTQQAGEELARRIADRIGELNRVIAADTVNLGPGFQIGHSFFCPQETEERLDLDWYRQVVDFEIAPLLREYWFDRPDVAQKHIDRLHA